MNPELLKRILELIGKTGDRVVIADPAGDKPYVLMGLEQYETILGKDGPAPLTPRKEKATMKRDIPLWKATPPKAVVREAEDEEAFYLEPLE
jgi:hypothetical protein